MSGRGGQDNEIGGEYRARVGAFLATAILLGDDISHLGLRLRGIPECIVAEADRPVDDLVVTLAGGTSVCFQAKQSLQLTSDLNKPFGKAIRQVVAAQRERKAGGGLSLVLVYARGSGPLDDLARWCEKLRFSERGVPSTKEQRAGDALNKLLSRLGVQEHEEQIALAAGLHLWKTDPRVGDAQAVVLQRLRGAGVPASRVGDAYDQLAARIRVLAQNRAGDDLTSLVAVLRGGGNLALDGAHAPNVRSALLVSEYRERTIQKGRNLAVFGVPATIAHIPMSKGDACVNVKLPSQQGGNEDERALRLALRRRGRIAVVGDGGSGKSTSLRVLAAELAGEAELAPLPLSAHCQDVLLAGGDPLAAAISNATQQLAPSDAELLRDALRSAFASGRTALLLDGLDEVSGRDRLAAQLRSWFETAPSTTEAVIATRPSGAVAALPWPRLQLARPQSPYVTARAIVSAVAEAAGHDEDYVEQRLAWFRDRLELDESLGHTPLIVALLATLAATSDSLAALPVTRPGVLWHVLKDMLMKWEVGTRRGDRVVVSDLPETDARLALERALFVLARVSVLGPEKDWRHVLARDLERQFGAMAPARLKACVSDAGEFWFATGLFREEKSQVRTSPRPLAEAALARQAIDEPESLDRVLALRSDPIGWATLAMIAMERSDVRSGWLELILEDGSPDELIAFVDAYLDGLELTTAEVERLCASTKLHRGLASDGAPQRVIEAFLALDPPARSAEILRAAVATDVAPEERLVLDVALSLRSEPDLEQLREFFAMPRPESGVGDDGVVGVDALDDFTMSALQHVGILLARHSRADAEFVVGRLEQLSTRGFLRKLEETLLEVGHRDLASQVRDAPLDYTFDDTSFGGDYVAARGVELTLASETAAPRPLSWHETRRLDELADLWASMEARWFRTQWVMRRPDVLASYYALAITLGGFDATAVAAQAQQILDELERDADVDDILRDGPTARPLTRWDLVDDSERAVDRILEVFSSVPYQCMYVLARALGRAPCREYAFTALEEKLPSLRKVWRLQAALVALALSPDPLRLADAWSVSDDARLRQAAAAAAVYALRNETASDESLALTLIRDHDRGVQVEIVERLAQLVDDGNTISDGLRRGLDAVAADQLGPYLCLWCDQPVPAGKRACTYCQSSGPDFGLHLDQARGIVRTPRKAGDVLASILAAHRPLPRIRRRSAFW